VQLNQRSDASAQLVDASGVTLGAASDVDAGAVEQLRAFESECRARPCRRRRGECAQRRRGGSAARARALRRFGAQERAELGAEQIGSTSRPTTTIAKRTTLGAPFTLNVATAKDYVALCEEKRRQAERDRAEADENSRRVSHSSNTDAPRTNKQCLSCKSFFPFHEFAVLCACAHVCRARWYQAQIRSSSTTSSLPRR
jgi:hypothetical protein